jgi:hypothetical protein
VFRQLERVLQQHRRGEGVDVSFPTARGTTHFPYGSLRRRGREAFVHEPHGQAASFGQHGGNAASLRAPLGLFAFLVERKANDKPFGFKRSCLLEYFVDGRTLPGSPHDMAGRRRDGARRVANRETDSPVSEVNGEQAHLEGGWRMGDKLHQLMIG